MSSHAFYCRKALTMSAPNSYMDRVTPSGGKGGDECLQREDFMNSSMHSPTTERTPSTRYRMAMTSSADDDYFTRRSCSVYLRAQQLMKLLLAVLILSRGFTHTLTQLL